MTFAHQSVGQLESKPVVLTIAGLDPSGGAGALADVRTFAAFNCFPTAALTSITFQNTTKVFGAVHQSAATVRAQVEPIAEDFEIAAAKTGMLPTVEVIKEIVKLISEHKLPRPVVDPVMISTSGDDLITEGALKVLRDELLPLALIVTPNIPEAERLAGFRINNKSDLRSAAEAIRRLGASAVLVKGGHLGGSMVEGHPDRLEVVDIYLNERGTFIELREEFVSIGEVHGSGCVLSAAIAASIAKGHTLEQAVQVAKQYVTNAIRSAPKLGHGARPL